MKTKDRFLSISLAVLFAAVFILTFIVMMNVPLMGDDYFYNTVAELHGAEFWNAHLNHYREVNGRAIVHILVTLFMKAPPLVWQIVNSLFLALIAVLSVTPFTKKGGRVRNLMCAVSGAAVVLSLMPDMTRESVYWLTGSCNYVYPLCLLFVFWNVLIAEDFKGRRVLLPVLAFLSAATTEQNGMMTLGLAVLVLADRMVLQKKKPPLADILAGVFALVGMATVCFTPSVFLRYGLETDAGVWETVCKSLPTIYYWFLTRKYTVLFVLFFFLSMGIYLAVHARRAKRPWMFRVSAMLTLPAMLAVVHLSRRITSVFELWLVAEMALVLLCVLPGVVCVFADLLRNRPNGWLSAVSAFILAVGSQLMMAVSPILGARTMLCGVVLLSVFSTALLAFCCDGLRLRPTLCLCAVCVLFLASAVPSYIATQNGFAANREIHRQNEAAIEEYKSGGTEALVLRKNAVPECAWSPPYDSPYHLYYFKLHYGLPDETEIQWVEP